MDKTESKETEIDPGLRVSWDGVILEPATEKGFTYWRIEKVYVQVEPRVKADDFRVGFVALPSTGQEVIVAFPAKFEGQTELRPGALMAEEFEMQVLRMVEILKRAQALAAKDPAIYNKESF